MYYEPHCDDELAVGKEVKASIIPRQALVCGLKHEKQYTLGSGQCDSEPATLVCVEVGKMQAIGFRDRITLYVPSPRKKQNYTFDSTRTSKSLIQ